MVLSCISLMLLVLTPFHAHFDQLYVVFRKTAIQILFTLFTQTVFVTALYELVTLLSDTWFEDTFQFSKLPFHSVDCFPLVHKSF